MGAAKRLPSGGVDRDAMCTDAADSTVWNTFVVAVPVRAPVKGSTESSRTCRALLRQLIERGMPVERARIVVIDGSKGLHKAVRDTFDNWALIQRASVGGYFDDDDTARWAIGRL